MIDFLRLVFLFTSLKKRKRLKLSRDTHKAFFSDTYSGLFSLMVDKSSSNGSDKGTLMFYTLSGNYSQAVLNVHCKKCLCYRVFSRLSESYSSSKKLKCISLGRKFLFYAFQERNFKRFGTNRAMLWRDNKLHTAHSQLDLMLSRIMNIQEMQNICTFTSFLHMYYSFGL